jgi:hypothetical protein
MKLKQSLSLPPPKKKEVKKKDPPFHQMDTNSPKCSKQNKMSDDRANLKAWFLVLPSGSASPSIHPSSQKSEARGLQKSVILVVESQRKGQKGGKYWGKAQ